VLPWFRQAKQVSQEARKPGAEAGTPNSAVPSASPKRRPRGRDPPKAGLPSRPAVACLLRLSRTSRDHQPAQSSREPGS
jgi:hypothetical protein